MSFFLQWKTLQYWLKWRFTWCCPVVLIYGLYYSKSAFQGCELFKECVITNAVQINNVINTRLRQYTELRLHVRAESENYWSTHSLPNMTAWTTDLYLDDSGPWLFCGHPVPLSCCRSDCTKQENRTFRTGAQHDLVAVVWTALRI